MLELATLRYIANIVGKSWKVVKVEIKKKNDTETVVEVRLTDQTTDWAAPKQLTIPLNKLPE